MRRNVDLRKVAFCIQVKSKFKVKSYLKLIQLIQSFIFVDSFHTAFLSGKLVRIYLYFLFTRFISFSSKRLCHFFNLSHLSNFQLLRFLSFRMILVIYFYSFSLNATLHHNTLQTLVSKFTVPEHLCTQVALPG